MMACSSPYRIKLSYRTCENLQTSCSSDGYNHSVWSKRNDIGSPKRAERRSFKERLGFEYCSSIPKRDGIKRKPLEFEVGDQVMLKVSPWKGVIRFGKKGFLTSLLDDGRGSGSWMFLFVWSGYAAMRTLCGQAKLLAVRYLVRVSWNSKCNFELTWVWEDYLKDKYPRLIVWLYETIVCYVLLANMIWIVVLERDRLLALMDCYNERDRLIVVNRDMFMMFENEHLNVD
ncbi:hypothetical protein Tco_0168900 [Tanacetum coccineum]